MENLLYDYHLAKSMGEIICLIVKIIRKLCISMPFFKKYGTTEATFDSSLDVVHTQHGEYYRKFA